MESVINRAGRHHWPGFAATRGRPFCERLGCEGHGLPLGSLQFRPPLSARCCAGLCDERMAMFALRVAPIEVRIALMGVQPLRPVETAHALYRRRTAVMVKNSCPNLAPVETDWSAWMTTSLHWRIKNRLVISPMPATGFASPLPLVTLARPPQNSSLLRLKSTLQIS